MARLLLVSEIAVFMESVILSAYMMTRPSEFLAARPMVCISEVADLKKPSLSASRMATRVISGISSPSRKRLIPTNTSKTSRRRSLMILVRSNASMSEWRYFTLTPASLR